ncbi:hypothetical protein LQW54_013208 [Pestalotiopsis sp. IQ-011]
MSSQNNLDRFRGRQRGLGRVTSLRQRFEDTDSVSGTLQPSTPSPRRVIFSGENRVPLRERLAAIRSRIAGSSTTSSPRFPPALSSPSSSSSSPLSSSLLSLSSENDPRPRTPSPTSSTPVCPPAPRKPRASRDIRERVSADRLNASFCDDDDIILDRLAIDVGDRDDWFTVNAADNNNNNNNNNELPCLPLALRKRTSRSPLRNCVTAPAPVSDDDDDDEVSSNADDSDDDGLMGTEMRRHLNDFWKRKHDDGAYGERDLDRDRLKAAYLNGKIDGALTDIHPGMVSVIEENRKKSDEGEQGASVDEMVSYLYGAIDQELPAWQSSDSEHEATSS